MQFSSKTLISLIVTPFFVYFMAIYNLIYKIFPIRQGFTVTGASVCHQGFMLQLITPKLWTYTQLYKQDNKSGNPEIVEVRTDRGPGAKKVQAFSSVGWSSVSDRGRWPSRKVFILQWMVVMMTVYGLLHLSSIFLLLYLTVFKLAIFFLVHRQLQYILNNRLPSAWLHGEGPRADLRRVRLVQRGLAYEQWTPWCLVTHGKPSSCQEWVGAGTEEIWANSESMCFHVF